MIIEEKIREESVRFLELLYHVEASDIPALGKCLNHIDSIPIFIPEEHPVKSLIPVIRRYIERLILEDEKDIVPLIACVEELSITHKYKEEKVREIKFSLVLRNEPDCFSGPDASCIESSIDVSDEDIQILCDFIVESLDSIDSLECSLVDLEVDTSNSEIINSVFRTFHTIKGVSGFLDLKKINSLSHTTENLLDDIRQGSLRIGSDVLDVIFESVDSLKRMIIEIKDNIEKGFPFTETIVDTRNLQARIEAVRNPDDEIAEMPLGEILVLKGKIRKEDLDEGIEIQKTNPEKKLGEILIENSKTDVDSINTALKNQRKEKVTSVNQVKIDTTKLDSLVDIAGEIVIAQSMLKQYSQKIMDSDTKFYKYISQLASSVSALQKIAMSMRMIPIRVTFQKMVRVIRDLSRLSGKEIVLRMTGEDTEIDRNMVEALYEPMVHMIRNSADHGIESPEERIGMGKPSYGTVSLSAGHKGGNILIEMEDDGRGLNREKILENALSKGLIKSHEGMTEDQIYELIFEPGFSTANQITDISGRGVGMDVVRLAIERMNGSISIRSTKGRGCLFAISLPLTLGVIEGIVVKSGSEKFIIPAISIIESFRPERKDFKTSFEKGEMILVRGNLIPLVRLRKIFGITPDIENHWDGIVMVVEDGQNKIGILVNEVLGKDEFVIKSLGESFRGIKAISGGAILGDGRVSLIIDVPGLLDVIPFPN